MGVEDACNVWTNKKANVFIQFQQKQTTTSTIIATKCTADE